MMDCRVKPGNDELWFRERFGAVKFRHARA
jgi:hypothetical protein